MLVFMEGGKPEYLEKKEQEKGARTRTNNKTQLTYDTGTGNRTQATLVEGESSHHCAIPVTPTPPGARGHGSGTTLQNVD